MSDAIHTIRPEVVRDRLVHSFPVRPSDEPTAPTGDDWIEIESAGELRRSLIMFDAESMLYVLPEVLIEILEDSNKDGIDSVISLLDVEGNGHVPASPDELVKLGVPPENILASE